MDAQALHDEKVIVNTFINETSVNQDAFRDSMSMVAGFPEGRVIFVTYYSQNNPVTDIQSHVVDLKSDSKDDVHLSFTEIRNFEIRCASELNFEFSNEDNVSKITSEAIFFPRFQPKISDIFLYEMRNGKIGVFRIASVERLALGQDTYTRVSFTLQNFLTPEYRDLLRRQTTLQMYFDKRKYIAGNTALMSSVGFSQKKDLEHLRLEIIENYIARFYSKEFSTFMRPDGLYDPYVVEYWNKKVSIQDSVEQMRPTQILIAVSNYRKTIWAALTNNPIKHLSNIEKSWNTDTYRSTFWGINITSLLGHKFITIGNEVNPTDIYSINRNGDPILVDKLPMFHKSIDPEKLEKTINKDFIQKRVEFYGDDRPMQKCVPHQHRADFGDICYPDNCKECEFDNPHFNLKPVKAIPPYPIMSNEELNDIAVKILKFDTSRPFTEGEVQKIRGYINWYREYRPGTLANSDLERKFREEQHIEGELTEEQQDKLDQHIKHYRSCFYRSLTDREIEYRWRLVEKIDLKDKLSQSRMTDLVIAIVCYRRMHGYPDINSSIPLGSPMLDPKEYANIDKSASFMLAPLTENELLYAKYSTDGINVQTELASYLPIIFYAQDEHAEGYSEGAHSSRHCHMSICHHLCGKDAIKRDEAIQQEQDKLDKAYYALSAAFYEGSAGMSAFEKVIYDLITNQEVDPALIIQEVESYLDWDDKDAFYKHMFALYMIDKALYWLMYH